MLPHISEVNHTLIPSLYLKVGANYMQYFFFFYVKWEVWCISIETSNNINNRPFHVRCGNIPPMKTYWRFYWHSLKGTAVGQEVKSVVRQSEGRRLDSPAPPTGDCLCGSINTSVYSLHSDRKNKY